MSGAHARANRRLAHRTELPMALGCSTCVDNPQCGGLKTDQVLFSCAELCRCSAGQRPSCPFVCQSKPQEYVRRLQQVGTFDLGTVGNVARVAVPDLPAVVPWIDSRSCLQGPLPLPAAAVPLRRLFSKRTGRAIDADRAALAGRFCLSPGAAVVVTGVSFEQPLEDYWGLARAAGFLDDLAALRPALVTTPNFSLFSDVPREDNLYNMKRIALSWHELASRGIPTALHLNARTDRDWERWREFLASHPEIGAVAFEFGTGAAPRDRARYYVRQLAGLAVALKRPLRLVLRGGRQLLADLRARFERVVFITPDPLMRARKRRAFVSGSDGRGRWHKVPYRRGEKVDSLFLHNLVTQQQQLEERP